MTATFLPDPPECQGDKCEGDGGPVDSYTALCFECLRVLCRDTAEAAANEELAKNGETLRYRALLTMGEAFARLMDRELEDVLDGKGLSPHRATRNIGGAA